MDNFDLKKYLVENKVTTNSKILNKEVNESVDAVEVVKSIGSLIFLGVMGMAYLPNFVREKLQRYKLDSNSTKEEIEKAARDLESKLTPREKSVLNNYINTAKTHSNKSARISGIKSAQNYLDKLSTRYPSDTEK